MEQAPIAGELWSPEPKSMLKMRLDLYISWVAATELEISYHTMGISSD